MSGAGVAWQAGRDVRDLVRRQPPEAGLLFGYMSEARRQVGPSEPTGSENVMTIKRKEFERDLVTYDQAGRPHVLRVYIEILDASTFTEAKAEVKGMTILVSPDRRTVKRLGKGQVRASPSARVD
jgi:hypothetical protein